TFLYSVFDGVIAPGLQGYSWFYAGADWTFDQPVKLDEKLFAKATLAGIKEVGNKRVAGMILQTGRTEYSNGDGQRLATLDAHCFRVPKRVDGKGGMPFSYRPQHQYSDEEFAAIEKLVLGEYRRGAEKRRWDSVKAGEELPV